MGSNFENSFFEELESEIRHEVCVEQQKDEASFATILAAGSGAVGLFSLKFSEILGENKNAGDQISVFFIRGYGYFAVTLAFLGGAMASNEWRKFRKMKKD